MLTLEIDRLGATGDGVAHTSTGLMYAPFTLPGETVRVEARGNRAALIEVLKASSERTAPVCPHFGDCGGCALQHMHAGALAEWKRDRVRALLAAQGLHPEIAPVWTAPPHSRRRAVFTAQRVEGGVALGFHRRQSREVVDMRVCPIVTPCIEQALPALRGLSEALLRSGGEARVTVLDCDNGLDCHIEIANPSPAHALSKLSRLATEYPVLTRLTVNAEEVFRRSAPVLWMGGVAVQPPPGAFVQAVGAAEIELARLVLQGVGKAKNVADLFCGLGTFTFPLARRAKVTAVEGDQRLLDTLDAAARSAQGLKPIQTLRRNLEREPLSAIELNAFDAVVFDPPFNGAGAQAEQIARSRVKTVVGVSCNPATFARDAAILAGTGFRIESVTPVDQFLFSVHIELTGIFRR
jgi:23S rRNA (uracil1939-C5)-methyltransferase